MVDIDTLKTLGTALTSIKAITDVAAPITNAKLRQEMNGKIAELQGTLLTARQQMLEMQEKYVQVLQENKKLRDVAATPKAKPRTKWGCYKFDGEDGLFCTASLRGRAYRAGIVAAYGFYLRKPRRAGHANRSPLHPKKIRPARIEERAVAPRTIAREHVPQVGQPRPCPVFVYQPRDMATPAPGAGMEGQSRHVSQRAHGRGRTEPRLRSPTQVSR